jgi:hypothetical protein
MKLFITCAPGKLGCHLVKIDDLSNPHNEKGQWQSGIPDNFVTFLNADLSQTAIWKVSTEPAG